MELMNSGMFSRTHDQSRTGDKNINFDAIVFVTYS